MFPIYCLWIAFCAYNSFNLVSAHNVNGTSHGYGGQATWVACHGLIAARLCKNEGKCMETPTVSADNSTTWVFKCVCGNGYHGRYCELTTTTVDDGDEFDDEVLLMARSGVPAFMQTTARAPAGIHGNAVVGRNVHIHGTPCTGDALICWNGGECYRLTDLDGSNESFGCKCKDGYSGSICQSKGSSEAARTGLDVGVFELCTPDEAMAMRYCSFGGNCTRERGVEFVIQFRCRCEAEFYGSLCELRYTSAASTTVVTSTTATASTTTTTAASTTKATTTTVATTKATTTAPATAAEATDESTAATAPTSAATSSSSEVSSTGVSKPTQNACKPNPCMNGCACIASCQHSMGYYCRSEDGGFIGKNCTVEVPSVECGADNITITVSDLFYDEFDQNEANGQFYLTLNTDGRRTNSCDALLDNRHQRQLTLELPFVGECGTSMTSRRDDVAFRNSLWFNREVAPGLDMPVRLLDFECVYGRSYNVVSSLRPVIHKDVAITSSEGRFDVTLDLCKVDSCPTPTCPDRYRVGSRGAVYTIGQRIHLSIFTALAGQNGSTNLASVVTEMFLSCDVDPTYPPSVELLSNGCTGSAGVGLSVEGSRMTTSQASCISFLMPRLKCEYVYIHVQLQLCQPTRLLSCGGDGSFRRCSRQPAADRVRRDVSDDVTRTMTSRSVIGPIMVIEVERTSRVQIYPREGSRGSAVTERKVAAVNSPNSHMIVVAVVGVGVICGILLLLVAYKVYSPTAKPTTYLPS